MSLLTRLAPLTGVLGIATIVASLAADSLPDSTSDNATLTAYITAHGVTAWFAMSSGIALGGMVLLVFTGVLAARIDEAGAGPVTQRVVQTAGTAWGVLTMIGGALMGVVPIKIMFYTPAAPTAELYPYLNALAYSVLVSVCASAAALLAVALSVAGLQSGVLPRWLAIAGFPAAVLMLANMLLPMSIITLYFVAVAITLTVRTTHAPVRGGVAEPQPTMTR